MVRLSDADALDDIIRSVAAKLPDHEQPGEEDWGVWEWSLVEAAAKAQLRAVVENLRAEAKRLRGTYSHHQPGWCEEHNAIARHFEARALYYEAELEEVPDEG